MMSGGRNHFNPGGNYTNPCLTMHQPWASLLVYGIKRVEGRSWSSPIRGQLWIHAAGKVPEEATIKAMEDFYREIYAVDGITDIIFPDHYPVSRLIGCIDVVGCVRREELANWEVVPQGARLEALTDYCWLCERPQKLVVPLEMRGNQRIYNLERKVYEAAVRGITPIEGPLPIKFPLPNPRDTFSLKPGSIQVPVNKKSQVENSSTLSAAIAGACAAATQYKKTDHTSNSQGNGGYNRNTRVSPPTMGQSTELLSSSLGGTSNGVNNTWSHGKKDHLGDRQNSGSRYMYIPRDQKQHSLATSKE